MKQNYDTALCNYLNPSKIYLLRVLWIVEGFSKETFCCNVPLVRFFLDLSSV